MFFLLCKRLAPVCCVAFLALAMLAGCGDDDKGYSPIETTSNATSNGTSSTSNGTTGSSNGTTATSNSTTATSNGTTATSNGTTATSNGTTATSNGTTGNDPCEDVNCADGQTCEDGVCIGPDCDAISNCEDGDDARCSDDGDIEECRTDEDGCTVWIAAEACGDGQVCDLLEGEATCVETCPDACEPGSARCDDENGIETCTLVGDICPAWTSTAQCTDRQSCDDTEVDVVCSCNDACSVDDAPRCIDEGTVETCTSDEDGCFAWDMEEECSENTLCNEGACACADARFTGEACDICIDDRFTGDDCDVCVDDRFTGDNCDTCSDDRFTGDNCDVCANDRFTGDNCDVCVDDRFTGDNCDTCVDPLLTGEECETFASSASYINSLSLEVDPDVGDDLNGDGLSDNRFGELASQFGGLFGSGDDVRLQDAVAQGEIVMGLDWPTLTEQRDVSNQEDVVINTYQFIDTDADASTSDAFLIEHRSAAAGFQFTEGTITNSSLQASSGRLSINIQDPSFAGVNLIFFQSLQIANARMTGEVARNDRGINVNQGRIAGAATLDSVFDGFNQFIASPLCGCGDDPLVVEDNGIFQCNPDFDAVGCNNFDESCSVLQNGCSVIVPIVANQADVDTTGDGAVDALSALLYFTAVGTEIVGVATDICDDIVCEEGFCDPASGECRVNAARCEGVVCNDGDVCDPQTGMCVFENRCLDVECIIGEICVPRTGICVPRNGDLCEEINQPCNGSAMDTGELVCTASDSANPGVASCQQRCVVSEGNNDCGFGFCVALDFMNPFAGVCLLPNCTECVGEDCASPYNHADCNNAGPNGGTCLPRANNTLRCIPAGVGRIGADCDSAFDCDPGLGCSGTCQPLCSLNDDAFLCEGGACFNTLNNTDVGVCANNICPGFDDCSSEHCPEPRAEQSACDEGFGCFPTSTNLGLCNELVGNSSLGEACEQDTCGEFLSCSAVSNILSTTCHEWCDLGSDDPNVRCSDEGSSWPTVETDNVVTSPGGVCLPTTEGTFNAIGICYEGCFPYAQESDNGCTRDGLKTCFPLDDPERGVCLGSGEAEIGDACTLIDNNGFGDCQGDAFCATDINTGTEACREICRTFSNENEWESGCEEGWVCEIFGRNWGVCTQNTEQGNPQAFEPCSGDSVWCGDDRLCVEVDQQGNFLCIPLCRNDTDDQDCPNNSQCELGFFDEDAFGLCLPDQ